METTPSLWALSPLSLFFLIIIIFSLPSYQLCALHQVRYKLSELSVTPLTHVYIRAHVCEHTYRHTHIYTSYKADRPGISFCQTHMCLLPLAPPPLGDREQGDDPINCRQAPVALQASDSLWTSPLANSISQATSPSAAPGIRCLNSK